MEAHSRYPLGQCSASARWDQSENVTTSRTAVTPSERVLSGESQRPEHRYWKCTERIGPFPTETFGPFLENLFRALRAAGGGKCEKCWSSRRTGFSPWRRTLSHNPTEGTRCPLGFGANRSGHRPGRWN